MSEAGLAAPKAPARIGVDGGWQASGFVAPDAAALGLTLAQSLADAAARWPAAVAVVDQGREISFAELSDIVGGLAAQIAEAPAAPGPVALLQSVGVDVVAAWFACALAGRPFLLLEPGNPPERNRVLMARAGVRMLLSDRAPDPGLLDGPDAPLLLCLEGRRAVVVPGRGLAADAPAMIFPTSGSTGEPKLITYAARTLQAKMQASMALMGAAAGDRVLIAGSHSNYGFLHHALVFLLSGGALCLADVREGGLAVVFAAVLDHRVRHIRFTPSLFRVAAAHPAGQAALRLLKGVRFSGEPLLSADLDLARRVLDPGCRIQNVYGSTESALFIWTDDRVVAVPPGTVPIGRIYPGWEFRIEDEDGLAVAPGDLGELVISSAQQALGDWQGGIVDSVRFPPDPRGDGRRLYRTGDIVRLGAEDNLSVAGRKDRLVKINGQRVSLDEIEAHLQAMPGVAQAAVLERPGVSGNRLTGFLVAAAPEGDPAAWLATRLPRHMLPSRYLWRQAMPLLPGGKVDRKALLESLPPDETAEAYVSTGDPVEDLAVMWRSILKIAGFAPDSDFFSLGGDSLLLMDLQLAVEARFARSFPVDSFTDNATFRRLVALLGLDPMAAQQPLRRGEVAVSFRLVRRAAGPSRGVAICMPGIGGSGSAELIAKSQLLATHDLWACDARLWRGKIFQHGQWLSAAEAAADLIARGQGPKPDLLIGYSVGGTIAWLVARLLAGSPAAPKRVISIDSQPMHRMQRYRQRRLAGVLANTVGGPIEMLDIRCALPPPFRFGRNDPPEWQTEDGRIARLAVKTVEHLDIIKDHALAAMAGAVGHYAETGQDWPRQPVGHIASFSGRVCELLEQSAAPDIRALAALLADPNAYLGRRALLALQFMALVGADTAAARAFCDALALRHPDLAAAHYAKSRLKALGAAASVGAVGRLDRPLAATPIDLTSCAAVDLALHLRSGKAPGADVGRFAARVMARSRTLGPRLKRLTKRLLGR